MISYCITVSLWCGALGPKCRLLVLGGGGAAAGTLYFVVTRAQQKQIRRPMPSNCHVHIYILRVYFVTVVILLCACPSISVGTSTVLDALCHCMLFNIITSCYAWTSTHQSWLGHPQVPAHATKVWGAFKGNLALCVVIC